MTFLSIIIPFNKGKRYLQDCLTSIKNQNIEDYEIILILNGLKKNNENLDDLNELINDLPIKTIEFDEEINVSKARNIGIKESKGEYIYFIDSDDYLGENSLSRLIKIAREKKSDNIYGLKITTKYILERFNEELENRAEDLEIVKNRSKKLTEFENKFYILTTTIYGYELLSALHCLIKKSIIIENNIFFDENKEYLSCYLFMINLINKSKTFNYDIEAIYGKRQRDDPIKLQSLNDEINDSLLITILNEYENGLEIIKNYEDKEKARVLKHTLECKLLKYTFNRYSKQFRGNQHEYWRNEYFDKLSDVLKKININELKCFKIAKNRYLRTKTYQAIVNKDKKATKKYINIRLGISKFKEILINPSILKNTLYLNLFNKLKINENQIIFESFRGDFYTDSPKYIYEYLYENYKDEYKFIWCINDKSVKIPGNPKKIKRLSFSYFYHMAKSKYWVLNMRQDYRLLKRPNQVILSNWHGTPLKRLGLDIGNVYSGSPKIKRTYIKNAEEWDYLVAPNKYTSDIYRTSFAYEGEILEEGYPRNDILYNADENKINAIKNRLNIPMDKKIILYAPTWRDDEFYDLGEYKFTLKLELDKLKESIGDEYVILIRTHYFIADNLDLSEYSGFAFDTSHYDDIAELYLISDILITDYSSVFFDYSNLRRPILFYTYDLDKYENILRGFYIDMKKEVPGPLLFTTEEVIDNIKNIDSVSEKYKERYDKFYTRFCDWEDGNATERIVNKVFRKTKKTKKETTIKN